MERANERIAQQAQPLELQTSNGIPAIRVGRRNHHTGRQRTFSYPEKIFKLAGIQQEVRFIGMDDTIEIWAKEIADKPFMMPEDFGKELEEIMGNNNNEGLE